MSLFYVFNVFCTLYSLLLVLFDSVSMCVCHMETIKTYLLTYLLINISYLNSDTKQSSAGQWYAECVIYGCILHAGICGIHVNPMNNKHLNNRLVKAEHAKPNPEYTGLSPKYLATHYNHWLSATSVIQCCHVWCSKNPDNTGWSLLHCCQSTSVEQSTTSSAWLWTVTFRVSPVTESTDLTDSWPDRFSFDHRFCFSF